jgi:hypothetical protein
MLRDIIRKVLNEATSDSSGSRGTYILPMQPGIRKFKDIDMQPFTIPVSNYDSPFLEYDSYDGSMQTSKKEIKKIEDKSKKSTINMQKHPEWMVSDDDGNNINPFPSKIKESKNETNEDLSVWFGKKKKPKGSSQPKGPWVNICRKDKDGKHPPCGRPDSNKGGYPKCRAAGVAGKMTDSQKKSACQQKRNAEKKDTQTGKGQKPIMTSYKTKKESIDILVDKIILEIRNIS